jgi:transcriptional regulator with XRE-family HTH domain
MSCRLQNYLRIFRKRAGLSQREVALLLGCSDGWVVSRYERFTRQPTLAMALTYEKLFGVPLRELFAGTYDEAWEALDHRARLLGEELAKQADPLSARKRHFLDTLRSNKPSYSKK